MFQELYYVLCGGGALILLVIVIVYIWASRVSDVSKEPGNRYYFDEWFRLQSFPSLSEQGSKHLSVIVPAYNEEKRLPRMLRACISFLNKLGSMYGVSSEIIIVNDGSTDRTQEVSYKYVELYTADKIRILRLMKNRGKGAAVRAGMQHARGFLLLFADADGATKFSDMMKLIDALGCPSASGFPEDVMFFEKNPVIVCGSRAHLEEEAIATRSFFRNLLMHGFHSLVKMSTVRHVRDTQCGFKLFTREAARVCFPALHVNGWAFDVELLYIAEQLNIPIHEVAVTWHEVGGSKIIPVISWLQMGRDVFLIWLTYRIGAWKIPKKLQ